MDSEQEATGVFSRVYKLRQSLVPPIVPVGIRVVVCTLF